MLSSMYWIFTNSKATEDMMLNHHSKTTEKGVMILTYFFKPFLEFKRLGLDRDEFFDIFEREVMAGEGKEKKGKSII